MQRHRLEHGMYQAAFLKQLFISHLHKVQMFPKKTRFVGDTKRRKYLLIRYLRL